MYFLDDNSKIPPTQVETALTTPNDTLIGIPTTVNVLPIVHPSGTHALSRVFTRARVKIFQGAAKKGRAIVWKTGGEFQYMRGTLWVRSPVGPGGEAPGSSQNTAFCTTLNCLKSYPGWAYF